MKHRPPQENVGLSQRWDIRSGRDFRRTVSGLRSWEEQRVLLSGADGVGSMFNHKALASQSECLVVTETLGIYLF